MLGRPPLSVIIMSELSSRQRSHLRSLAHPLRPVFQIGKDGLTPTVVDGIRQAFNKRELLKIRVLENAEESTQDVADRLARAVGRGTTVVQVMGKNLTLYRPHPDHPEIKLP